MVEPFPDHLLGSQIKCPQCGKKQGVSAPGPDHPYFNLYTSSARNGSAGAFLSSAPPDQVLKDSPFSEEERGRIENELDDKPPPEALDKLQAEARERTQKAPVFRDHRNRGRGLYSDPGTQEAPERFKAGARITRVGRGRGLYSDPGTLGERIGERSTARWP